jgi:hypothetical protein
MLKLREDENGFCDVADRGRAEHDVLQDAPRWDIIEAAFALLAQGSQHRVTGFVLIFSAPRAGF